MFTTQHAHIYTNLTAHSFTSHVDKPSCTQLTNHVDKPYCTQLCPPCGQATLHTALQIMWKNHTAHSFTNHVDNTPCIFTNHKPYHTQLCIPCGQVILHTGLQKCGQTILHTALHTMWASHTTHSSKKHVDMPLCTQLYKQFGQAMLHTHKSP